MRLISHGELPDEMSDEISDEMSNAQYHIHSQSIDKAYLSWTNVVNAKARQNVEQLMAPIITMEVVHLP